MRERQTRPTPERRQHGTLRRSPVIPDATGGIGHPWHAASLLDSLLAKCEIEAREHAAAIQFAEIARRANLPNLRAADLLRQPGTGRAADGFATERARRQLAAAIDALGGLAAPMGSLAFDVLGLDDSLSAWSRRQRWTGGRQAGLAKGVLMAALPLLARHFGLTKLVTGNRKVS